MIVSYIFKREPIFDKRLYIAELLGKLEFSNTYIPTTPTCSEMFGNDVLLLFHYKHTSEKCK